MKFPVGSGAFAKSGALSHCKASFPPPPFVCFVASLVFDIWNDCFWWWQGKPDKHPQWWWGVASCITITICGGASDSKTAKAGDKEVQCFDEDFELLQDIDRGLSNVSVNFI